MNDLEVQAPAAGATVEQRRERPLLRLGLMVFAVIVTALLLYRLSVFIRGPDYALGRRWTASSMLYPCYPERKECGGAVTTMFFCTVEEEHPWLEIDLGEPVWFSLVSVKNRIDCCQDRAVPMVIEVSMDRKHYVEVAQRDKIFDLWDARFQGRTARYLRLTVTRRTFLHLEHVEVRR
jgi:hypothetical protein